MDHRTPIDTVLRASMDQTAKALQSLPDGLYDGLRSIHDHMQAVQVTHIVGVGKSHLVALKAAAVFRSIGYASNAINAVDLMHGDFGAIDQQDLVILVSNSGSTPELRQVSAWLHNHGVKTVLLTGREKGYLQERHETVVYGPVKELYPHLPVPTVSTIIVAAIFDALVATILYGTLNPPVGAYKKNHPGGQIGVGMTPVKGHMSTRFRAVEPTASMSELAYVMGWLDTYLGAALVVGPNGVQGIVTDGDMRRAWLKVDDPSRPLAKDIMSRSFIHVEETETLAEAVDLMQMHRVTTIVVQDALGASVGLLSLHDALVALGIPS